MSWDVLLMNLPPSIQDVSQLNDQVPVLGPRDTILSQLRDAVPGIDLSDPTWGVLDGSDFSIEFSIGSKDPVDSIALHVRGADSAVQPIADLVRATGWRAMDFGDCSFIDFSIGVPPGFKGWQAYAGRIIEDYEKSGAEVVRYPRVGGARFDAIVSSPVSKPKRSWWQFWKR